MDLIGVDPTLKSRYENGLSMGGFLFGFSGSSKPLMLADTPESFELSHDSNTYPRILTAFYAIELRVSRDRLIQNRC